MNDTPDHDARVEAALREINQTLQLSSAQLGRFAEGLFAAARDTGGATFEHAAVAATTFARQGLSTEETIKRTRDALTP